MSIRDEIIASARRWRRTPFHHHARVKGVGVDCLNLLVAVYQESGLLSLDYQLPDYPRDWHLHNGDERYLRGLEEYAVKVETPMPGDIASFKFGRVVSHAAIIIKWPMVIHALSPFGVVESNAEIDAEIRGRLNSFWTMVKQ